MSKRIWLVFWNTNRTKRMLVKLNARISGTGRLPGDDGQGANTTELNYMSVGVGRGAAAGDPDLILGQGTSDFELVFDDLS